jgi:tetratricopeptide (TPR) repeat protein
MDAGVAGVVAMRYNVYVVTAAQFVADLYAALAQGQALGEAVTLGRKQLHTNPLREIAYAQRPLQDWPVPIVYEAAPIELFPKLSEADSLTLSITDHVSRITLPGLPPSPDIGFFGRDETLLALDRAFDTQRIVLLHAFAGSGKTTTAAEFARWYALTGGLDGPVLFTSFEQYKPLARVLDTIEQAFSAALERSGVQWLALTDDARRDVTLQVLAQIPVLWIWDNVEPVMGFPRGTASAWSAAEQKELADFLRAARETKAKFLLTSRRDEHAWLSDLPARISVPPMPMQERVQLARALAERHGRRITDVKDWRPLLYFTQGNPLTITVLVGELLREWNKHGQEGSIRKEVIEAFVAKLRAGEAAFEDEVSEGRSKSLGASLSYGFQNAFTEPERKQLALLHFFQGFVDVNVLRVMGAPEIGDLPELHELTREAGIALLDRADEIGLLTAHGNGFYSIHPALPWYFKSLFDQYYSGQDEGRTTKDEGKTVANGSPSSFVFRPSFALFAFVSAMGELGNYYTIEYVSGNRDVIAALNAEEANLLHARQLARANGWWRSITYTMQGLRTLYAHTGRRTEWARLVHEITPDFIDSATDGPLPGHEEEWNFITEYRVRLALEARQWAEAERLQRIRVEWDRRHAAPALAVHPDELDDIQRNMIRSLAVSSENLGTILRELGKPECVTAYEETINLCQHISDKPEEAIAAFNLGHAYKDIPALRDLMLAESWYRRSLDLFDERDQLGRGKGSITLGNVAYERFIEAQTAKQSEAELLKHLNSAFQFYQQALALLPLNAVDDLAITHNTLGFIYDNADDLNRAFHHYREAIRYDEAGGNLYRAGQHRRNIAIALANAGRREDALAYAREALRNFETYGEGAAEMIGKTRRLIEGIEGT